MTRIAFLKKYALKFAVALSLLGLIAYTLGHAVGMSANSLLTTPVRAVTDKSIASSEAYIFRDEAVLSSDTVGLVDEIATSGKKVGKNAPLVQVVESSLPAPLLESAQQSLDRVNRALRILRESAPPEGESKADANAYRQRAADAYMELCAVTDTGDVRSIAAIEEKLLVALNRYLLLSGKTETLAGVIADLEARRASLLGTGEATLIRNDERSGVFYGRDSVDGYEGTFNFQAPKSMTAEDFARLRAASPAKADGQTVGKVVYGYEWYAVMELPQAVLSQMAVGREYAVTFPENGGCVLRLTLERTDGTMAVFYADDSPADFTFYRMQTAQITVSEHEGYYVPESALHTVNGQVGVYVLENSTLHFRRVKILWRGDGYCIAARAEDGEGSEIYLNDMIVTEGRKLYDGKVYE